MSSLSSKQKQLLFDFCLGITSEQETAEASVLISSNKEATELHSKLTAALSPLDSLEPEPCPEDLAQRTILRLNNAARASQLQLEHLLAHEQAKDFSRRGRLWRDLSSRLATAAAFMIVGTIVLTAWNVTTNYARQKSWQVRCQAQLAQIFQGISNYSSDYNGQLPAVARAAGAPWWKVGDQGQANHSNTRHSWLLVKGGYVEPGCFVCPGKSHTKMKELSSSKIQSLNDFPERKYITYSLRIMCNRSPGYAKGPRALMADLNPLFEKLPKNYSGELRLRLNKKLHRRNSINHSRRGQNVLFCNGSVKFVKTRRVGISEDDIFTLRDREVYRGVETPTCEADTFLAP